MLSQASLFENLLNNASNQKEKELIIELFNIIQNFYYILDIYENCNINTKIFNYLFETETNHFIVKRKKQEENFFN